MLEKNKAFVSILNWNTYPFCGFLILIVLVLYVNQSITSVIWYIFFCRSSFFCGPQKSLSMYSSCQPIKKEKKGSNKVSSQFFFCVHFFFFSLNKTILLKDGELDRQLKWHWCHAHPSVWSTNNKYWRWKIFFGLYFLKYLWGFMCQCFFPLLSSSVYLKLHRIKNAKRA